MKGYDPMRRLPLLSAGVFLSVALSFTTPASADATVLRYRLTTGQTLAYTVSMSSVDDVREGVAPIQRQTDTDSYDVHYDFGRRQPDGAVALRLRIDHATERLTKGGKTTVTYPHGDPTLFWQEPDGRQLSPDRRYTGAYSNGDLGALTDRPVATGSTWTSTLTDQSLLSAHELTCRNILVGWLQGSPTVADISTVCSGYGHGTTTHNGVTYRASGSTMLAGRWAFDVKLGVFLAQRLTQQTLISGTETDRHGTRAFSERTQSSTVQQLMATF